MRKIIWRLLEPDPAQVAAIRRETGAGELLARLLANREVASGEAKAYLAPALSGLADPALLPGMDAAACRIADAVLKGERIAVWGDLDTDGVCATAIMVLFLRSLGADPLFHVPERSDGYGVNGAGVRMLAASGARLVVTVDSGIGALKEADICKRSGLDLVVTDHHVPGETLPEAAAVVNPRLPGSSYPCHPCGAGVAFLLCAALRRELRKRGAFGKTEPELTRLLPLAALATVADVVPLCRDNRIIASRGLTLAGGNTGLSALCRVSGLDPVRVDAGDAGFRLAPRLNAAGRLASPLPALELLLCSDAGRAQALADGLDRLNAERQREEEREVAELVARIEEDPRLCSRKTLVFSGAFHPGVVGLVASRIAERYHRPTVVIAEGENGKGRGSGRSIPGFDLERGLNSCAAALLSFGGHPAAAGLSLELSRLGEFIEAFEAAAAHLTEEELTPVLRLDAELAVREITLETAQELCVLQPCGMGNRTPVFWVKGAKVVFEKVLKEKHLRLVVEIGGVRVGAVGWNLAERAGLSGKEVELAGTLEAHEFQGERSVELCLRDLAD